ncbi:hypothetical protein, partial [Eubacterium sp.]
LMTISVEMVSTSSKLATVYLSCPPPGGLFSIYQNANYGLSYKGTKSSLANSPARRVFVRKIYLSAPLRSFGEFLINRNSGGISY